MIHRTTTGLLKAANSLWVFIKHPFTIRAILLCCGFWIACYFLSADKIIQILNYVVVSVAVGVLVAYMPAAIEAARSGNRRTALLATGICLIAFSAVEVRIWSILIRIYDWETLRNSYWIGFFLSHALVGFVLHLVPPGASEYDIPARNWWRTGILVCLGLLTASLLIGFGYDRQLS